MNIHYKYFSYYTLWLKYNYQVLNGIRFDTLVNMVGETLVILYVHPLIFLSFFSLITKVFIYINEYAKEINYI